MVFGEAVFEVFETFFGRVDHLEEFEVPGRDRTRIDHDLEVDELFPILAAVNYNQNLLGHFLSLGQGEDFEEFVEGPETSWENYQRFGQVGEPELPHEEVMELEMQGSRLP